MRNSRPYYLVNDDVLFLLRQLREKFGDEQLFQLSARSGRVFVLVFHIAQFLSFGIAAGSNTIIAETISSGEKRY